MPVIKKVKYRFRGEVQELQICYNEKKKFHYKELPNEIFQYSKFYNSEQTLENLESAFNTAKCEVEEKLKTRKKVICINLFLGDALFMKQVDVGHWVGEDNKYFKYKGGEKGFGFGIDYSICYEVVNGKEKLYHVVFVTQNGEERVSGGYSRDTGVIIEYTPERELFLKEMQNTIVKMTDRVVDFLEQDSEKIQASMDRGIKLLKEK